MHGLGSDIIEVERIARAIKRSGERFLSKIFTHTERTYCERYKDPAIHYAGAFAAKEAVAKALGTGFRSGILSWHDIQISHDPYGKPLITLSEEAQGVFGTPQILITISHCRSYATATALIKS